MIHFNIGAVAVVKLFQALDIPLCKYTEEGFRLQDLLSADVVQQRSKYQEEMKNDRRPQNRVRVRIRVGVRVRVRVEVTVRLGLGLRLRLG